MPSPFVWPVRVASSAPALSIPELQGRILEADTMRRPSGEKAHAVTTPLAQNATWSICVAREGGQFGACLSIPELQGLVAGRRDDAAAIGGEGARHTPNSCGPQGWPVRRLSEHPRLHGAIPGSRHDAAAIRGKSAHAHKTHPVARKGGQFGSCLRIPELQGLIMEPDTMRGHRGKRRTPTPHSCGPPGWPVRRLSEHPRASGCYPRNADTMRRPSGEKAHACTTSAWPARVASSAPV